MAPKTGRDDAELSHLEVTIVVTNNDLRDIHILVFFSTSLSILRKEHRESITMENLLSTTQGIDDITKKEVALTTYRHQK